MRVTRFDRVRRLIVVLGSVWGPRGRRELRLALDTAAVETILVPDVLDDLGYNPREGSKITSIQSAVGSEPGYLIHVPRFRALGFQFDNFRVHTHDLPEEIPIHGLLGLSFLDQFNYEVRSSECRILCEQVG